MARSAKTRLLQGTIVLVLSLAGCAASVPPDAWTVASAQRPRTIAELDQRWLEEGDTRRLPDGIYSSTFDGIVEPPPGAVWQERVAFAGRYALDVAADGQVRLIIDYTFDSALSGPAYRSPALSAGRQLYVWTGRLELVPDAQEVTVRLEPARETQCAGVRGADHAPVAFDPSLCSSAMTELALHCRWQRSSVVEAGLQRSRELDLLWCAIDGGHLAIDSWISLAGQVPLSRRTGVHFYHEPESGVQSLQLEL